MTLPNGVGFLALWHMKGLWNYPPDHVGAKEVYWKKESLCEKDPYDNDTVTAYVEK